MAGLGRRTHYRKYLTDQVLYDFPVPLVEDNECIAKIVSTRGGNQFDVLICCDDVVVTEPKYNSSNSNNSKDSNHETNPTLLTRIPNREAQLAILPTKYRKLVWLKRNDYVIVQTTAKGDDQVDDDEDSMEVQDDDHGKKEHQPPTKEQPTANVRGAQQQHYHQQQQQQQQQGEGSFEKKSDACDTIQCISGTSNSATINNKLEPEQSGSIRCIIRHILYKDQIKHIRSLGLWPSHDPEFTLPDDTNKGQHPIPDPIEGNDGIVYLHGWSSAPNEGKKKEKNSDPNEVDDDHCDAQQDYHDDDDYSSTTSDPNGNDADLFVNTNRMAQVTIDDSSSSSDDERS